MLAQAAFALACLAAALWLRPWRMLGTDGTAQLVTPVLATLVVLPWMWASPALHAMPLQLQWSGGALVLLMLGWPLAVPVLLAVGAIAAAISPMTLVQALDVATWQGLVPATLALGLGAVLRRFAPPHLFIYILGRGFLGTVACLFAASALRQAFGDVLPDTDSGLAMMARWLMAWADGVVTGMLVAVFVAYRPQWLATWSDARYLRKPPAA